MRRQDAHRRDEARRRRMACGRRVPRVSERLQGERTMAKPEHEREAQAAEDRSSLPTAVIYEVVRKRGDEEMARPTVSLWWSGVAAGLSISFSLLAQTILQTHLPDA